MANKNLGSQPQIVGKSHSWVEMSLAMCIKKKQEGKKTNTQKRKVQKENYWKNFLKGKSINKKRNQSGCNQSRSRHIVWNLVKNPKFLKQYYKQKIKINYKNQSAETKIFHPKKKKKKDS